MIPGFERRKRTAQDYNSLFGDLPLELRWKAQDWLDLFLERHRGNLSRWLYPLLKGQAKRLALNPATSEWGRRMLAIRGGRAVQESYRWQGRIGESHPAHKAARVSASRRRWRKEKREEEKKAQALGLPPKISRKFLPLH